MIVAQISDLHVAAEGEELWGGYSPDNALAAILAFVLALDPRPDLILFTGDLVETGAPAEYANFRRMVAEVPVPMAAIPGNHDRRAAFVEALAGSRVAIGTGPWLNLALEDHPARILALDSVAEGESAGLLCAERLDWLATRLGEAPQRPTLVFLHHQPFEIGIPFADRARCRGGEDLRRLVAAHPQVQGVACGHVHRSVQAPFAHTIGSIAPSVAWEVPLDLAPDAGPRLTSQNPGLLLHVLGPGGGVVRHAHILAGFF